MTKPRKLNDALLRFTDRGAVTASAVVATVDDIARVRSAHEFEAFVALPHDERSSVERWRIGRITKAGNSRVCYPLVEAWWRIRGRDVCVARTQQPMPKYSVL